jgi:hypothetical protein
MPALKDAKTIAAPFSNQGELVRVVYDFAKDTGAIANYDLLIAQNAMIVKLISADVKTAVTSADAVAIDLGKGNGGAQFWADKLKAALAINVQDVGTGGAVALAATDKIVMGVKTHAITAGKIEFIFEVFARV